MAGIVQPERRAAAQAFSFADLEQQGRRLLEQAHAQARQILAQAEAQARQVEAQRARAGYEAGRQEGRAEGLQQIRQEARAQAVEQARDEIAALSGTLQAAMREFELSQRALLAAAEAGLIELALAVARRVCKLAAAATTDVAAANVRQLLEMVRHAGDAELRVHPTELERLRELAPALLQHAQRLEHLTFVGDEGVGRGGAVLRTRDGQVDARLETQLDRIAAALLAGAAEGGGSPAPAEPAETEARS